MPAPAKIPVGSVSPGMEKRSRRRVVEWINREHGGNVSQAARAIGVSYAKLYWRLFNGGRMSREIILGLVEATGLPAEWWLG